MLFSCCLASSLWGVPWLSAPTLLSIGERVFIFPFFISNFVFIFSIFRFSFFRFSFVFQLLSVFTVALCSFSVLLSSIFPLFHSFSLFVFHSASLAYSSSSSSDFSGRPYLGQHMPSVPSMLKQKMLRSSSVGSWGTMPCTSFSSATGNQAGSESSTTLMPHRLQIEGLTMD